MLYNNYPNPFNPTTTLKYYLQNTAQVEISVWNILGEKVADLLNQKQNAGDYAVNFNAADLPSGIYIAQVAVNGILHTKKMALIK